jgi:phage minor structural protein
VRSFFNGQEEMIIDADITRKNTTNGEKTLDITARLTDRNQDSYKLMINENFIVYGDDEYVIKKVTEKTKGKRTIKTLSCEHRFYEDLISNYIYDTQTKTMRIDEMLDMILAGTGYTYTLDDTGLPLSVQVENFGDGNSLALFQSILQKFGCEFEISGTNFIIAKEISRHTDNQFRYLMNIKEPSKDIDTSSLCTYIRGFGKQNEDGSYIVTAEYTSPLAELYGIKHASPVRDERFTDYNSLLTEIKSKLNDSIPITITMTYIQLKELGIQDIRKGDYVWCIIEPFNINAEIRVVDVEDYNNTNKSPVFTLGILKQKSEDIISGLSATQSTVNAIVDPLTNTVKSSSLSSDVANAVNKINDLTTANGNLDLTKSEGRLPDSQTSVGANTVFSPGYDPTKLNIPSYSLATESTDGLMSHQDKQKLNAIIVDENGEVVASVPLATDSQDGLFAKGDFTIFHNYFDTQGEFKIYLLPVANNGEKGLMSNEDYVKLTTIESNAQVNTVDSVNGRTGAVELQAVDIYADSGNTIQYEIDQIKQQLGGGA